MKDSRGGPSQLFKLLLPVGVLRAGEDAVLTPWKVLSHDAEVILPQDLEEKTTQGKRKRGGNGSFWVNVCPGSEAMSYMEVRGADILRGQLFGEA